MGSKSNRGHPATNLALSFTRSSTGGVRTSCPWSSLPVCAGRMYPPKRIHRRRRKSKRNLWKLTKENAGWPKFMLVSASSESLKSSRWTKSPSRSLSQSSPQRTAILPKDSSTNPIRKWGKIIIGKTSLKKNQRTTNTTPCWRWSLFRLRTTVSPPKRPPWEIQLKIPRNKIKSNSPETTSLSPAQNGQTESH